MVRLIKKFIRYFFGGLNQTVHEYSVREIRYAEPPVDKPLPLWWRQYKKSFWEQRK